MADWNSRPLVYRLATLESWVADFAPRLAEWQRCKCYNGQPVDIQWLEREQRCLNRMTYLLDATRREAAEASREGPGS